MSTLAPAPRVLVWRSRWLSGSETFIRDQLDSYQRWQPSSYGVLRLAEPLVEPDFFQLHERTSVAGRAAVRLAQQRAARRAGNDIAGRGFAIVHAHFGQDGLLAQRVAARCGLPSAVTFHGRDVTADTRRSRYRRALQRLFADATVLIAVSDFIAGRLAQLGADPAKVVTHHTGIPLAEAVTWSPHQRAGVLVVGRLVEKKGADGLLRAYATLPPAVRAEHPLTIAGTGPLEQALRVQADRLGVHARFAGRLNSTQVAQAMQQAAVVCVPSRQAADGDCEGLPTVVLEAFAHSAAVVASRHAGIPEAVAHGRTGLLFDEAADDQLADQLHHALGDPALRTRLGAAARARVEADFDVRRQTRALESIYDAACARAWPAPE